MPEGVTEPASHRLALATRAEELYRSERTIVTRQWDTAAGGSVIRKQLLGPDALARMRHETRIIGRLAGVQGVSRLLSTGPDATLVLQDGGQISLADSARFAPVELVGLALRLARILAEVHRRGVLHLDISPANILHVRGAEPELIDFHLATLFAEERRGFTHQSQIAGTLAYIAPEQTGRMGRAVDHRADLYALGATLYEFATGVPPFGRGDPLRLIRDHLATVPLAPSMFPLPVPRILSDIIMRLLEKEPEQRYQSAEGLAHDLERLDSMLAEGQPRPFPLGAGDFPHRLASPSRLIGREAEITELRDGFEDALEGHCRALLISGAPGIGKTSLIDQLRPIVTARGGWFVTGKFEQYRQDGAPGAVRQAMSGIISLLLAEPGAVLTASKIHLRESLGASAGFLLSSLPEITALIGETALPAEVTEARAHVATTTFLRTMVSPSRPLVMVLDDLQWASSNAIRFIGSILAAEPIPGLLLVGAYRDAEVDVTHPLMAALTKWTQASLTPRRLRLQNLPPAALEALLAEMLRLPAATAALLAEVIGPRSAGNPFDTVELLNSLRRDGTLTRGADGWRWDTAAIRRHVGQGEVIELLRVRIAALPAPAQEILADMACLGGELPPDLLARASGVTGDVLEERLAPALEDGLLVLEQGGPDGTAMLRFRHDRVQQAVHGARDPAMREGHHLTLARRLAPFTTYAQEAAEQYLPVAAAITDSAEREVAAVLLAATAEAARRVFRHASAERYFAAAIILHEASQLHEASRAPDVTVLTVLRTARLTMLYNLGRHDEADRLFAIIGRPESDPLALAEASCVQVLSLTNRGRHPEAMAIGLEMLAHLGIRLPVADLAAEVASGLTRLRQWLIADQAISDGDRVETHDPLLRAAARLINRMLPGAALRDPLIGGWLVMESQRLWAAFGVCPELVANLGRGAVAAIACGDDYRTGYEVSRHTIAVGSALGYERETALAQESFATFGVHWFEPLENTLSLIETARLGLIEAGEIQAVCITYIGSLAALLDCAPTLEVYAAEVAAARAFAARTGNEQLDGTFHSHLRLLGALNGEADAAACLAEPQDPSAANPMARFGFHSSRALLAVLMDDQAQLDRHSAAVMPLLSRMGGAYRCTLAWLLRALSLARGARASGPDNPRTLPAEFTICRNWFAARALDAPGNFEHLLHFIDAEGAWTLGDLVAGGYAFDRALQCCSAKTRPWHHALIAERSGLFFLANGLDYFGRGLLLDARRRYADWGPAAVVRRLVARHGFLQASGPRRISAASETGSISSEAIDLFAIVQASQAMSSETMIDRLHARVVDLLAGMTGAASVSLVLWDDARQGWCLRADTEDGALPVEDAAARGALPLSAFNYVERTRIPLVVDDATLDDRFARDPYFAGMERCSLLALPVQSQGAARAVLLLENRLSSGVFSNARVDVAMLVAGQLAVSLENARLYASLEQRVAERTEALAVANQRLEALSISDGLTGLANRRRFDEVLQSEWLRALRGHNGIAMVMIDIDHFKHYNDHYGHVGGDRCLRAVAEALRECVRLDVDLAARYGGEEFALILPGADVEIARSVCGRTLDAVLALHEPHALSAFGQVSVSVGAAVLIPDNEGDAGRLVELADAALYRAKQQGRNRLVLAEPGLLEQV